MNALGHLPFSTIPMAPILYLLLAPLVTSSLVSTIIWISLGAFLLSREERRLLAVAARHESGHPIKSQLDETGSGNVRARGKRYRKGKEIWRSEKRILEDEVVGVIPDEKDRLRWYRERARELQMRLGEGEDEDSM